MKAHETYTTAKKRAIVVGSGPVGIRFTEELFRQTADVQIEIFGNEPYKPYNRVQLSAFLAGEVSREQLDIELPQTDKSTFSFTISTIKEINKEQRYVVDADGGQHPYDVLVLATGSKAHLPNIEGNELSGVFCFRNLKDAEHLYARVLSSRHIVIVGGGLLGCEAARALGRYHTQVTLVQQASRLMNRQLDDYAAGKLQAKLEAFGVRVIIDDGVRYVHGDSRVTGVDIRSGEHIECDTVLFCAGITPNLKLARQAGLRVANGIVVSDQMQTSDPAIYAIGECCEHQGQVYGLVNPGFEQAAVAASHIAGQTPEYKGSLSVSRLKVVGEQIFSIGEVADLMQRAQQREVVYRDDKHPIYRKVIVQRGRLIGALAAGDWPEMNRVQEAFMTERNISWWRLLLFRASGRLWLTKEDANVAQWPENTLVCQCNGISRGQLSQAMTQGCATVATLQQATKAGTICGSCKPLLEQLCDQGGERQKEIAWLPVMVLSLLALALTALLVLIPELKVADSVQTRNWFEAIWNDKFFKQVSGFTLLGLTVIGLLMSLRKRLKFKWPGEFAYWRVLHLSLGALCGLVLIFHTGFHLGDNLNRILIIDFLAILLLGSSAGMMVAISHKYSPAKAMSLRKFWAWVHILLTWPLPALLGIHILTVYYF